jgi:hypothetical protein
VPGRLLTGTPVSPRARAPASSRTLLLPDATSKLICPMNTIATVNAADSRNCSKYRATKSWEKHSSTEMTACSVAGRIMSVAMA